MKTSRPVERIVLGCLTLCPVFIFPLSIACGQGTAFTYQSSLEDRGLPATGTYDVQFTLYTTNLAGCAIVGPITNSAITVSNGRFTVAADFGPDVFSTGATYWLDLAVRTNGGDVFIELTPRQPITPVP